MRSPEAVLRDLIAENWSVTRLLAVVALGFAALAWLCRGNADAAGAAWLGAGLFALLALAFGLQAVSMKRRLERALKD